MGVLELKVPESIPPDCTLLCGTNVLKNLLGSATEPSPDVFFGALPVRLAPSLGADEWLIVGKDAVPVASCLRRDDVETPQ